MVGQTTTTTQLKPGQQLCKISLFQQRQANSILFLGFIHLREPFSRISNCRPTVKGVFQHKTPLAWIGQSPNTVSFPILDISPKAFPSGD
jgi:hypothetical protein